MSTLYIPRKPKRFRVHKSIPRGGLRLHSPRLMASQALVVASDYGQLNWRHLEAGRRFLVRQVRRSRVSVLVRLRQPITAKSKQARMGKGKGKLRGWVAYVRPGTALYEVGPTGRQSWTTHRSGATRLRGRFPFERMAYKFSYGVQVRRRTLLVHRRQLPQPKRPGYSLWNGRVTPLRPEGVEHRRPLRRPPLYPLQASLLNHMLGFLALRPCNQVPEHRRPLVTRLLQQHWWHLAYHNNWNPLEPPPLNQLGYTLHSLDQLLTLEQLQSALLQEPRFELVKASATQLPQRWRVSRLGFSHPLLRRLQSRLSPAGGFRWLSAYPPRLLRWRSLWLPPPMRLRPEPGPNGNTPMAKAMEYSGSAAEPEYSPYVDALDTDLGILRRLLRGADWGYAPDAIGGVAPYYNPLLTVPPTMPPDPGFLVPRSPEAAAHDLVMARARGIRRQWVLRRLVVRWWWVAPWMRRQLPRRQWQRRWGGCPRYGRQLFAVLEQYNADDEAEAEEARQRVLDHFRERDALLALQREENQRAQAAARAAGTEPPLLLPEVPGRSVAFKGARQRYRRAQAQAATQAAKTARVVKPPMLAVVAEYSPQWLAPLKERERGRLWRRLRSHCNRWGLTLTLPLDGTPRLMAHPDVGQLDLGWLTRWVSELRRNFRALASELRERQEDRVELQEQLRRRHRPRQTVAPFWAERRRQRCQWRFRFRYERDLTKALLPIPSAAAHPQPAMEDSVTGPLDGMKVVRRRGYRHLKSRETPLIPSS